MKLNLIIALIVTNVLLGLVSSQTYPPTTSISVVYYDLTPQTNPDFEIDNPNQVIKGLVQDQLGVDRKPQYCCGDSHAPLPTPGNSAFVIHSRSTFSSWFRPADGINVVIKMPLELHQKNASENPRLYTYSNDAFFPLDNKGFEDPKRKDYKDQVPYYDAQQNRHNFHFCMELHASFAYQGGEVFRFTGDDDVWVFIDNRLVVDLGAPHTKQSSDVNLDTLGLTKGKTYKFDFFYCERHSTDSHILIETTMILGCSYKDFCGVCEGDGSSCCQVSRDCDDYNPCTIDGCPPPRTQLNPGEDFTKYCKHDPVQCKSDVCNQYRCKMNSTTTYNCIVAEETNCLPPADCKQNECMVDKGGCVSLNVDCSNPLFPDNCFNNYCGNSTCQHEPIICNDFNKCTNDQCFNNSGCSYAKISCDDNDYCTTDSCDKDKGCQHLPIPNCLRCASGACITTDKCFPVECDPLTGKTCVNKTIDCDDGNPCTNDSCFDGKCTNEPIKCKATTPCTIDICNPKTGKCEVQFDKCDDFSECTLDSCVKNTTTSDYVCTHALNKCDDSNPCTDDLCVAGLGCTHNATKCPDTVCGIGSCDPKVGCTTIPRPCPVTAFCLEGVCDIIAGGCVYFDKKCIPDNPDCEVGICNNQTKECTTKPYDPLPFKCQSTAVKAGVAVGAAAIAGIVIGGAAALALAAFGGQKGYQAWKNMKQSKMAVSADNPLYSPNPNSSENPLYNG
ncbi:PA14 domain-containing protein [Tieghemostelium lacteum]|uniref:PA14 domain-containing protein n=1 Tax=Tieghemostelium lacteum TaxID=361077 RepID=A0A152A7X5_TIELA|nr:PA14 domain-containing protein [Tieghemostelium lacteum]|eukprot:KYR02339.1 PA14 domain-containing protein [Tieghemostelium lacteum]